MLSWSQLTERKLNQFEINVIRQLDQRYFYVLRTPNGAAPQYLDDTNAEKQIATALRSLAARHKEDKGGVSALPDNKPKVTALPTAAPMSRLGKE